MRDLDIELARKLGVNLDVIEGRAFIRGTGLRWAPCTDWSHVGRLIGEFKVSLWFSRRTGVWVANAAAHRATDKDARVAVVKAVIAHL